jgi:lysophospholipase L1-like esterase
MIMNFTKHKILLFLPVLAFIFSKANAQQIPIDENKIPKQFPQVSLVFNRIFNGSGLDSFYQKLQQLKKTKNGLVTIVHIGDSHLKSDNLTGVVRKGLQDFFGDAGKGSFFSKNMSVADGGTIKDSTGVLYHSFGINGARYESYNNSVSFWQQVAPLKADLFIISLGTNDAQASDISDASFHKQVTLFLDNIKKTSPAASVLVTTTADSFKAGLPNRELWNLNLSLFSYCTAINIPVWDMYRVTNGFGSAYNWLRKRMMNGDGIHFTAPAYKIQGQLLFNALAKGYNSYVSSY